jgi:hypothetical protein
LFLCTLRSAWGVVTDAIHDFADYMMTTQHVLFWVRRSFFGPRMAYALRSASPLCCSYFAPNQHTNQPLPRSLYPIIFHALYMVISSKKIDGVIGSKLNKLTSKTYNVNEDCRSLIMDNCVILVYQLSKWYIQVPKVHRLEWHCWSSLKNYIVSLSKLMDHYTRMTPMAKFRDQSNNHQQWPP